MMLTRQYVLWKGSAPCDAAWTHGITSHGLNILTAVELCACAQYFDESRKALAAQQEQQQQEDGQGADTPIAGGRPPATPATQLRAPMRKMPASGPASAPPKMAA